MKTFLNQTSNSMSNSCYSQIIFVEEDGNLHLIFLCDAKSEKEILQWKTNTLMCAFKSFY